MILRLRPCPKCSKRRVAIDDIYFCCDMIWHGVSGVELYWARAPWVRLLATPPGYMRHIEEIIIEAYPHPDMEPEDAYSTIAVRQCMMNVLLSQIGLRIIRQRQNQLMLVKEQL